MSPVTRAAFVIARRGADGAWVYWRGKPDAWNDRPGESRHRSDAMHFSAQACALEAFNTHPELDPDRWYVLKVSERLRSGEALVRLRA